MSPAFIPMIKDLPSTYTQAGREDSASCAEDQDDGRHAAVHGGADCRNRPQLEVARFRIKPQKWAHEAAGFERKKPPSCHPSIEPHASNLDLILTLTGGLTVGASVWIYLHRTWLACLPHRGLLAGGRSSSDRIRQDLSPIRHWPNSSAEVGVILLMFGVGLRVSYRRNCWPCGAWQIPGALTQSPGGHGFGAHWLHHLFGWDWSAGVVFGLAISVASTVVLIACWPTTRSAYPRRRAHRRRLASRRRPFDRLRAGRCCRRCSNKDAAGRNCRSLFGIATVKVATSDRFGL